MEEQLPIPSTNNQTDNLINYSLEVDQEMKTLKVRILFGFYGFGFCILCLKFLWYIFLWFLNLIGPTINYNYNNHTHSIEDKYFSHFNIYLFPNLILSSIIICLGGSYIRYRYKRIVLINLIFIAGKIVLFYYYYKVQKIVFYIGSDVVLPKISLGIETTFISIIIILEFLKVIIIRKKLPYKKK